MSIETMDYQTLVRHLEKSAWAAGVSHIDFKHAQRDQKEPQILNLLKEAWDIRRDHSMHVMDQLLDYDGPVDIDTSPLDEANRVIQASNL